MLTVMPYPVIQFFDGNGDPLAGGFLYTYAAGTPSTPQATYLDDAGTLNTNPVELDAAGRAVVYLTPSLSYKFFLTTALGVPVWTQDEVMAVPVQVNGAVLSKTGNYTVQAADGNSVTVQANAASGPFTVSLYTAVGHSGNRIRVIKTDSTNNAVTVDPSVAETVNGVLSFSLYQQWDFVEIESNGVDWLIVGEVQTIRARLYRSGSAQSITSGSAQKVELNAVSYDTASAVNIGLNRFIAPRAGTYVFSAAALISNSGVTAGLAYVSGSSRSEITTYSDTGNSTSARVSATLVLGVGDYIEFYVSQASGGARDITDSPSKTFMEILRTGS